MSRFASCGSKLSFLFCLSMALLLAACGGSSGGGSAFSIGGSVTGLSGTLVLQNNGADDLSLTADGSFTFATAVGAGATYAVTVLTQPTAQTCTVSNGSGAAGAAVTDVSVSCVSSTVTYSIGGSVTGLSGTVILQNNGADNLSLSADGSFTFGATVGGTYAVTVLTQPTGQTCTVSSGSGTASADVSNVSVACIGPFTIGGSVSGLTGTVILQNNGADNLSLSANGSFTFATAIGGVAYAVTVLTQPTGQTCLVSIGSGTASAAVSNVSVTCASSDATLSALTFSAGTLSPAFASSTASYSSKQVLSQSSITVTPTASASGASITVNSITVISGSASSAIALGLGSTLITVAVTALDGVSTQNYSTTVTRGFAAEAYIKAANADAADSFGLSVSISGDTIVVGTIFEDSNQTTISNDGTASADNTAAFSGAAYVFLRNGSSWSQQAYLKAPNAEASDSFGQSVAIDGDTIVVGANGEDSNQITITNGSTASADNSALSSGAAYVFTRSGGIWSLQSYLKASNAEASDNFGGSVAISGDTIVVGAVVEGSNQTTITNGSTASADNSAVGSGAAYVFTRSGSSWSQQAYLKASNAETSDKFGTSVAIDGDTIVVGANGESSNQITVSNDGTASADNSEIQSGATYVFLRSGVNWSQQAYLKAPNAEAGDNFGGSVAISGDTIVVGAFGEDSNQTTITNGSTASADNTALQTGAVYVFLRSGTSWSQQAYLKASNAEAGDSFGGSVAISGDSIVVGADFEDSNQTSISNDGTASADNTAADSGAGYVFLRSGANWSAAAYLKVPNAEFDDRFGSSVAISGDTIVAGAINEDSNQTTISNGGTASADNTAFHAGAAYVFQ